MKLRPFVVFAYVAALLAACGEKRAEGDAQTEAPAEAVLKAEPTGAGPTLKRVKARGRLNCGVHPGLAGFAQRDNRGRWRGFDADFCRATAAAVLGDADAVRFVPLDINERFEALKTGRVDVLWRNTSINLSRDAGEGLDFPGVNYFDGQGFLVRRSLNLTSATELVEARVCVQENSTSQLNVADFFRSRGVAYQPVVTADEAQARAAYAREECDAFTADISALAAARSTMNNPADHAILPEVISKEPLGPVVRQGDPQWADVVRWVLYATIQAEELGVTSRNAEALARETQNPEIRRLLGVERGHGAVLGLDDRWARRIVDEVGNYGEIFERNIGPGSPLGLERGLNAQWNADEPGLLYAPPFR
jgi:general L-amino acid transport system substrate-binding protein